MQRQQRPLCHAHRQSERESLDNKLPVRLRKLQLGLREIQAGGPSHPGVLGESVDRRGFSGSALRHIPRAHGILSLEDLKEAAFSGLRRPGSE